MGRKKLSYSDNLFKELKDQSPEATDSTIKTYISNLMLVSKFFDEDLSPELFQEFDVIKEYLTSQEYSMNTIKNKVSAIISYLKMKKEDNKLIQQYKDYFDMLDGKLSRQSRKMEKNDKEKDNWMTKDDLVKQLEYLKSQLPKKITTYGDLIKYMKYIILLIHISYPFRNDLSKALIVNKSDNINNDDNYIVIDKKGKSAKFIIQAYKTKRTYKRKELNIIPEIAKEIINYEKILNEYKKTNNINNDLFLIDKKGGNLTTNDFTLFFKSIFENLNKDITATMIRKIIVSSLYDVKAIKALSDVMMHSPQTALQYYAKS
jgi:hypothetical protein